MLFTNCNENRLFVLYVYRKKMMITSMQTYQDIKYSPITMTYRSG